MQESRFNPIQRNNILLGTPSLFDTCGLLRLVSVATVGHHRVSYKHICHMCKTLILVFAGGDLDLFTQFRNLTK
jgi:hypothetical protein